MKLFTSDGRLQDVRSRKDFLSGNGSSAFGDLSSVKLVGLPSGLVQTATYYDIYRSNPWLYAAVNTIAWGVSRMPIKLYRFTDSQGNRERVRGDVPTTSGRPTAGQVLDRVLHKPEPRHGRMHVTRRRMTDVLLAGNSLLRKERDDVGQLRYLHHVPWRRVTVQEGETALDPIAYYEIATRSGIGKPDRLIPEDVVHLTIANDPDKPVGMSPVASLRYTIALFNAMQRHLVAFFANQARPSGHVGLEKGTSAAMLELIREQIKQLYTAPENAGNVLVTTGKWDSITTSPEHSAIVELVKLSREEVAATYGVAPPLMGILDRAIMGNVRELRIHHMRELIGPWAALDEQEFNAQLIGDSPALAHHFLEHDLGEALRPDFEARAKALRDFQSTLTLNERRKIENLPKIDHPDADAVFLPLNESPIGEEDEPAEPPPGPVEENGSRKKNYIRIGPSV